MHLISFRKFWIFGLQFFSNWRLIMWLERVIRNCCPSHQARSLLLGSLGLPGKVCCFSIFLHYIFYSYQLTAKVNWLTFCHYSTYFSYNETHTCYSMGSSKATLRVSALKGLMVLHFKVEVHRYWPQERPNLQNKNRQTRQPIQYLFLTNFDATHDVRAYGPMSPRM